METCIGLMVLAIIIVGILSGLYFADKLSIIARYKITAVVITESLIEDIMDTEYNSIADSTSSTGSLPEGQAAVTATEITDTGNIMGKEVVVSVSWSVRGVDYSQAVSTFVRKH